MYYPSSENKGADQLRSYCEADLRLCFHLGRVLVFPCVGSNLDFCNYAMQFPEVCNDIFVIWKISDNHLTFGTTRITPILRADGHFRCLPILLNTIIGSLKDCPNRKVRCNSPM